MLWVRSWALGCRGAGGWDGETARPRLWGSVLLGCPRLMASYRQAQVMYPYEAFGSHLPGQFPNVKR